MQKVKTTRFGEIEVEEASMLELPHGLVGFPELKRYILLDHEQDSPFKWLQSLDDGAIAFVLMNPLLFKPDYSVEVTDAEVSDLELEEEADAVVSVIITMPNNPQNMTANLKAPVVFNLKNRRGKQIILNDARYTTRHSVIEEMKKFDVEASESQKTVDQARDARESEAQDELSQNG